MNSVSQTGRRQLSSSELKWLSSRYNVKIKQAWKWALNCIFKFSTFFSGCFGWDKRECFDVAIFLSLNVGLFHVQLLSVSAKLPTQRIDTWFTAVEKSLIDWFIIRLFRVLEGQQILNFSGCTLLQRKCRVGWSSSEQSPTPSCPFFCGRRSFHSRSKARSSQVAPGISGRA